MGPAVSKRVGQLVSMLTCLSGARGGVVKIVRAENSYGRAVSENNQAYQQVEVVERCTRSLCMGAADAIVTIREQKSNRIDNISLGDLKVFLWCGALVALRS